MRLRAVHIKGYRSLEDVVVPFTDLTAFIGPNGSGKSSILGALRLFFEPSSSVNALDFWSGTQGEVSETISVVVTLADLNEVELRLCAALRNEEQELVVERRFEEEGRGAYLASRPAVPKFAIIRNSLRGHRDQFNELVDSGEFEGLTRASNKEAAFAAMAEWERKNPEGCEIIEQEVDISTVMEHFTTLFVDAFESPAQHLYANGKGAVSRLLEGVIDRSVVDEKLQAVADEAGRKSDTILAETRGELDSFSASVKEILTRFAPRCSINVRWAEAAVAGARPRLQVDIQTEGGPSRPLEYQGHGVQRSLMYAALTAEVEIDREDEGTVFLVIEEPEAFQHPLSCRVLGRTLRVLSGRKYQVAYSTHSPEFVHAETVDGLRIVRHDDRSGRGAATYIEPLAADRLLAEWRRVFDGDDYTVESVLARLSAHLTPRVLEGLFARYCILVEGEEDAALVRGAATQRGLELDTGGVAVVQTNGKGGIPNVLTFLGLAGVECYPIFDLDRSKEENEQHRAAEAQTLRALRVTGPVEEGVGRSYACWHDDFGRTVAADLSPKHEVLLDEAAKRFGYPAPSRARKVAVVVAEMLRRAAEEGVRSETLESLAEMMAEKVEPA